MRGFDGYLTLTETAAAVEVITATLRKWVERGWFPPASSYFGARPMWSQDSVQEFLANPEARKPPPPGVHHAVGEGHGATRWPKAFVVEVKRRHADGQSLGRIAKALGMSKSAVQKIVNGTRRLHG